MKKKLIRLSAILVVLSFITGIAQAQGLTFRFSGGYGTMRVDDYNKIIEGVDNFFDTAVQLGGLTREGEFQKLNMGFEYDGEIIVNITRFLGIGIGAGYIQRGMNTSASLIGSKFTIIFNPKFTAYPLRASAYLFLPAIPFMDFYVGGGVGYYFANATYLHRFEEEPGWFSQEGKIKSKGLGYHGAVGLRLNLIPKISLFVEGRIRSCKLKGWTGDETYRDSDGFTQTTSGTTWYFDIPINIDGVLSLPQITTGEQPSDAGVSNVREFKFDFSGMAIVIGIMIRL